MLLPAPRTPLPLPRHVHPLPWSRPAPSPCCPFLKHPSPGWPSLAYTCQTHQRLQASGQGRSCRRQEGCGALRGVMPSGCWASPGPVPTPSPRQSQRHVSHPLPPPWPRSPSPSERCWPVSGSLGARVSGCWLVCQHSSRPQDSWPAGGRAGRTRQAHEKIVLWPESRTWHGGGRPGAPLQGEVTASQVQGPRRTIPGGRPCAALRGMRRSRFSIRSFQEPSDCLREVGSVWRRPRDPLTAPALPSSLPPTSVRLPSGGGGPSWFWGGAVWQRV